MLNIDKINDPILMFGIFMTIVLISPLIAKKTKIPTIIYLILGGMIIGPYGFKIVIPNSSIELLRNIGLLYIMFEAGLEINLHEVEKNKHQSIIFGLLTFLIPLILGLLASIYILKLNLLASILLASLFSSHTLITYPIISKLGLNKRNSVTSTIGGTIITDVLALVVLAIIIATYQGNLTLFFWSKFIILSLLYIILTIKYIPKIAKYFFLGHFSENGSDDYTFVITITFILAYISHLIGLEAIIGGFLSGLVLNSLIPERSALMSRIKFIGETLFIPFFLISVGMLIDSSQFLKNEKTILISLVMVFIAIIAKFLAALIFGKIINLNKLDSYLIFSLSVNQAAATLAAVTIGYELNIFTEYILAGTITMIMVTCFLGSFSTDFFAKKIIFNENDDEILSQDSQRILVPINSSNNLENLMEFSFLLQNIKKHEPLYFLKVILDISDTEGKIIESENLLNKVVKIGKEMNREIIPLIRIQNMIPLGILQASKENRISKVILSWDQKHINKNRVFGTVIDNFINKSKAIVYVVKLENKLGTVEKTYILVSKFIKKHKGFLDRLNAIRNHLKELNTKVIFICEEDTKIYLEKFFKDEKKIEYLSINNWNQVDNLIFNLVKKEDMVIQFLGRNGEATWSNFQDKLAKNLVENLIGNYIGIYLPCLNKDECSCNM
ncbi:MAG: cation:proton antiporter [Cetobacterium sp.]